MNHELFARAQAVLPGGVNSPVRAFGAVGGIPKFIQSAQGATLYDVEANAYIDFIGSWGPMILGHNHPFIIQAVRDALENGVSFGAPCRAEVDVAELLCQMTGLDMVRMVNSGTEAVMSALRVARGFTGREKLIKFEGCYHGHSDSMLVNAGSGALTGGAPDSLGVTVGTAKDTLCAKYNDLASVEQLFKSNPEQVAAIVVEPVAANMGVVPPEPGFLQGLRTLCDQYGAVLIFDEVITGFRLCAGGAMQYYGVQADMACYGKIIGGGFPVGAYGAKRAMMQSVAPLGKVYQAGTLSGNPVAMAAGYAQLTILQKNPQIYAHINELGELLANGLRKLVEKYDIAATVNHVGSLCTLFFTQYPVRDLSGAKRSDTAVYGQYFHKMLDCGIYFAPAQFEAAFVNDAHTKKDIAKTLLAAEEFFIGCK